jgi:O-antigen/teichoic acid export membrane protein
MKSKTTTTSGATERPAVLGPGLSDPLNNGFAESEQIPTTGEAPGVLSSSVLILAASVIGCGLNYLFGIYLARMLGAGDFGLYAIGVSLFNILILLAPLGLDTAIMKYVSQSLGLGETHRIRPYILLAGGITLICGVVFGACLGVSSGWLAERIFGKPELTRVLVVFAIGIPIAAVSGVLLSSLRALHDIRQYASIKYLLEPIGKFALAAVAVWLGWGLAGVMGAILMILTVSTIVTIVCLLRMTDYRSGHNDAEWALSVPAFLAFSYPLVVSNLFGILAPRSDVLFIGAWFTSRDVGVYSAASQTAAILGLIMTAFHSAVIPMIGTVIARKDQARLESLFRFTSRWTMALSLLIFIYFGLFGREILHLFGEGFAKGAPWLIILASGHLVNSASGPATATLIMAGYPRTIMVNSIVMGLLLIGANMLLIPRYGALGAAWAMALHVSAGSVLCIVEAKWLCGVTPFSRSMAKPLWAGAAALAVGGFVKSALLPSYTAAVGLLVTAIFAALLLAMKLDSADRKALLELAQKFRPLARWLPAPSS